MYDLDQVSRKIDENWMIQIAPMDQPPPIEQLKGDRDKSLLIICDDQNEYSNIFKKLFNPAYPKNQILMMPYGSMFIYGVFQVMALSPRMFPWFIKDESKAMHMSSFVAQKLMTNQFTYMIFMLADAVHAYSTWDDWD